MKMFAYIHNMFVCVAVCIIVFNKSTHLHFKHFIQTQLFTISEILVVDEWLG